MTDYIMVKVAILGKSVQEVTIPVGSTVGQALAAANINKSVTQDLRLQGKSATINDIVKNQDIITLAPAIKGGI